MRVVHVGSLQSRGFLVWVDLEQMKGSTVDTMALAVEGVSEVVMVTGVSRAYKDRVIELQNGGPVRVHVHVCIART